MSYIDYDKIAEEAARRYPIGTDYIPLDHHGKSQDRYTKRSNYAPKWVSKQTESPKNNMDGLEVGFGYIYVNGIWAEVVSYPENYKPLNEPAYEVY